MQERTELQKAISELARFRSAEESVAGAVKFAREQFDLTITEDLNMLEHTADFRKEAEERVRKLALAEYHETGNKKPHPAAGVRVTKVLEYHEGAAKTWVRENMPTLMILDKKKFEKMAKAGHVDWSGVKIVDVAKATISKDLGAYLDDSE